MRYLILLCNLVLLSNPVYARQSTHNYTLAGTITLNLIINFTNIF